MEWTPLTITLVTAAAVALLWSYYTYQQTRPSTMLGCPEPKIFNEGYKCVCPSFMQQNLGGGCQCPPGKIYDPKTGLCFAPTSGMVTSEEASHGPTDGQFRLYGPSLNVDPSQWESTLGRGSSQKMERLIGPWPHADSSVGRGPNSQIQRLIGPWPH